MSLLRLQSLQDEMKKCFRCSLCKMVPLPTIRNQNFSDGCPAAREFHFHGYVGMVNEACARFRWNGKAAYGISEFMEQLY